MNQENIYPIFKDILSKEEREIANGHKAFVLWFTGLSGSGKSTIAKKVERILYERGYQIKLIDGDNIRSGLNNNLGFTIEDRIENIRRVAELSKLFVESGMICLSAFISPTKHMRKLARDIIGGHQFIEVFVDTPLSTCEERDVKGLYLKAREGKIADFTGIASPYEAPDSPEIHIVTENKTVDTCVQEVTEYIVPRVRIKEIMRE